MVIGINAQETPAAIAKFIEDGGYSWLQLRDERGGLRGIPGVLIPTQLTLTSWRSPKQVHRPWIAGSVEITEIDSQRSAHAPGILLTP